VSKTKPNQDPAYMGPKEGPFKCSNCEYFIAPTECTKKEMKIAQDTNGKTATVDPNGCCNYYEKK
jgi:hypothetical protein